jgi:protein TonB
MVVEYKGGDEKHYLNYFVGYMQLAIQGKETLQKNRERNFVFDIVHNKVLSLGDVLKPEVVEQIKGDAGKATIHMAMDNEALTVSYKKNGKMTSRTYVYHTQKDVFVDNIKELVDWAAVEKREQDILAQNAKLQKEIEEAYGGVIKWTEKDKLERVPSFPGGDQAMMMWLFRHQKYPAEAKAKGIRGNVICAFIVEPDGQLSTVKVIKSLDPDLDAEAIRLVNAMPKWTSGKQNGEPVRVRYDLTVNFFMR